MSIRTRKTTANEAYTQVTSWASALKNVTQGRVDAWSATGTTYESIGAYLADLLRYYNDFSALEVTPGLLQAARDAEDDPAYNIQTEINTLQTRMIAVKDRILDDVPKQDAVKKTKVTGYVTEIDSAIASIDGADTVTARATLVSLKSTVEADLVPEADDNYREVLKFNGDGSNNWRSFSAAALSNLIADMQLVISQID